MATKTIEQLLTEKSDRGMPYPTAVVRALVAKVGHTATFSSTAGPGKILNFSIADKTGAMIVSLNDSTRFEVVKEGKALLFRNFILKGPKIILTKNSKLLACGPVAVDAPVLQRAKELICPPSPKKSVGQVLEMPVSQIVTVTGLVVRDEAIRTVKVGTEPTPIHTFTIQEDGNEVEVSLWRELSKAPLTVGEFVEVTQCVTGLWQNKAQLNSTRNTTVSTIAAPEKDYEGTIEGITINGNTIELAMVSQGNFSDFVVETTKFLEAMHLPFDEQKNDRDLEEAILLLFPITAKLKVSANKVGDIACEMDEGRQA